VKGGKRKIKKVNHQKLYLTKEENRCYKKYSNT